MAGEGQVRGPDEGGTGGASGGQGSPVTAEVGEETEPPSQDAPGEESGCSTSGYMEVRGISALRKDSPDEDPSWELGLQVEGKTAPWNAYKVSLVSVQDGKVIEPSHGGAFHAFNRVYQDMTPYIDIDEAYLDVYTGQVDIRLGIQKFAWGRLDEINPTDNLNPEDLTEGGTNDEVDRKIGVPALKVNAYSDAANVEVAFVPFYVPYRLPDREERWFPRVLVPPESVDAGATVGRVPVRTYYRDIDLPPRTMRNAEAGIRVSRLVSGWDLSASYFTGFDPMPLSESVVDVDVTLVNPLSLEYTAASRVTLMPALHRIHVFGFDFTGTLGDFTLRGEYAYFHGKRYNRRLESVLDELVTRETIDDMYSDFLVDYFASGGRTTSKSFRLDAEAVSKMDSMKYGVGVDYIHGDTSLSVQLIQEFVPDHDNARPVYFVKDGFDTLSTFLLKQFFLQNTLELNLRVAYDLEFHDHLVKPSARYHFTDRLQGTVGAIVIGGGRKDSLLGQFGMNDQVYAQLRCSF